MKYIFFVLCLLSQSMLAMEFSTQSDHPDELATVELLTSLMKAHDVKAWQFTNKIHIDRKAIPHSHPVLTLHTRHTSDEQKDLLLSTYLHEQIHWFLDNNIEQTNAAIDELKAHFSAIPVGFPAGARSEYSGYLHLITCYLELEALSALLSADRVNSVSRFWQTSHYTWIYQQVQLQYDLIGQIVAKHNLQLP